MHVSQSQSVGLEKVTVHYRDIVAIKGVSLEVPAGEILALLGPSGCGKTTLLRSIAGFVPHTGEVYIGGIRMARKPPHRRNIGMVFQDYALFPHMTVAENVGFGLRMRRHDRKSIATKVSNILGLVGLEDFQDRMAPQLSGGQQQRVALARALVIEPSVLLLDEPLSALDKKLREEMRAELKRIQRVTGVTTIFVTHDQDEALGLADRLALMYQGDMLQLGTPETVYRHPINRVVAEFLGAANRASAICREVQDPSVLLEIPGIGFLRARSGNSTSFGNEVTVFVRPERIGISPHTSQIASTALNGVVTGRTYLGRHLEFTIRLGNGASWTAHCSDEAEIASIVIGSAVTLTIDPSDVLLFRS